MCVFAFRVNDRMRRFFTTHSFVAIAMNCILINFGHIYTRVFGRNRKSLAAVVSSMSQTDGHKRFMSFRSFCKCGIMG